MEFKTQQIDGFFIVGVEVRTTNANNQAQQDIGLLWERIFAEGWAAKIPNRVSDDIYSTYLNYESDYTAPYTYVLGYKVATLDTVLEGFTAHTIPAQQYHVYAAKGKIPQCIHETWMHIWHNETERGYKADFEVFGPKAQDMQNAELEIYIGVK